MYEAAFEVYWFCVAAGKGPAALFAGHGLVGWLEGWGGDIGDYVDGRVGGYLLVEWEMEF